MKKWDAIIIGSGISSLTCAALLSKKGKSVCVLEQHTKPGGYLHCFNRFRKRFDTGAHYVGAMDPGQPFHTLLNYLGVYDESLFVPLDPEGFDVFRFPSLEVELPKGYEKLIPRLQAQFPNDKDAVREFFTLIHKVSHMFPTYQFNEKPQVDEILKYLDLKLSDVVNGLTTNPELRAVLLTYCVLHGVAPEDVAFGLHSILVDSLIRGPYGFAKGGDALADNFVKKIKENGGDVRLKTRVQKIETKNKRVQAVITDDGERFEAEWVISGIHPKLTFGLLDDPSILKPAFRQRLARLKETAGIFGVYARCATPAPLNPLRNYYYMDGLDTQRLLEPGHPEQTPHTVFISPAERTNPDTTALNIHAVAPVAWFSDWESSSYGKRPDAYQKLKLTYADQVLDFVEAFEPGLKSSIDQFATSTPITNLHFNGSVEGSPYGIYHSIENTGVRALGPATHVENLFLTGQSSLFPGLLGASVAALRTSGYMIGIKPILKELRELGQ